MPRNRRNSRSSASMVTLVSSSPFHQPAGDWRDSRCARAAVSAVSAVRMPSVVIALLSPVRLPVPGRHELGEAEELLAYGLGHVGALEPVGGLDQPALGLLLRPGPAA